MRLVNYRRHLPDRSKPAPMRLYRRLREMRRIFAPASRACKSSNESDPEPLQKKPAVLETQVAYLKVSSFNAWSEVVRAGIKKKPPS